MLYCFGAEQWTPWTGFVGSVPELVVSVSRGSGKPFAQQKDARLGSQPTGTGPSRYCWFVGLATTEGPEPLFVSTGPPRILDKA